MKDQPIIRDERTVMVENASYRIGFTFLSFGLLVIVVIRGFLFKDSSWDLMGLVVLSGLVTTVYQGTHHILSRRWIYMVVVTAIFAALVAFFIVFFTH